MKLGRLPKHGLGYLCPHMRQQSRVCRKVLEYLLLTLGQGRCDLGVVGELRYEDLLMWSNVDEVVPVLTCEWNCWEVDAPHQLVASSWQGNLRVVRMRLEQLHCCIRATHQNIEPRIHCRPTLPRSGVLRGRGLRLMNGQARHLLSA